LVNISVTIRRRAEAIDRRAISRAIKSSRRVAAARQGEREMIRQRASAIRLSIFFKDTVDADGKLVPKRYAPVCAIRASSSLSHRASAIGPLKI